MTANDVRAEAVLFDLGGTLVCHSVPADLVLARALREAAGVLPGSVTALGEDRLRKTYSATWVAWKDRCRDEEKEFALATLLESWLRSIGTEQADTPRLAKVIERIIYRHDLRALQLLPTARETLEELKRNSYVLGVVTNTSYSSSHIASALEHLGILTYFETVVVSSAEGVAKPNPELFVRALDRLSLCPDQAIFVGNDVQVDVMGARRAGLRAILVRSPAAEMDTPTPAGVLVVAEIADILRMLGVHTVT
jgi:HAD superfamily hydrolase (TIGR01662 family)